MAHREIFTRAELAGQYRRHAQRKQEQMTAADIGRLMRKTVHEALDKNGTVGADDFKRANVPDHAIATRGMAIIAEVLDERLNGGITA